MTHGMDLAEVRRVGSELQRCADALRAYQARLDHIANGIEWLGDDAEHFRGVWWPEQRIRLGAAADELHGLGQSARNNADEQQQASLAGSAGAVGGAGSFAPRPAPLGSAASAYNSTDRNGATIGSRIPDGSHASTSDYVFEIGRLKEGEIALRLVSEGPPPRYVLMLRGLDMGSDGVNSPGSTLADWSGVNSPYQQKINALLDSLPPDAQIGIIGHSQGGIAAIEVAQGDPRVQQVLTLGSPIDQRPIRPGLDVLSIVNVRDPVPYAEPSVVAAAGGGGLAGVVGAAVVEGVSSAGPGGVDQVSFTTNAINVNPGVHHGIDTSYLQAVEMLEHGGSHPVAWVGGVEHGASWLADFEATFGGGNGSQSGMLAGGAPTITPVNRPTF